MPSQVPSIAMCVKVFNALFDTFYFAMFALLTPFVKNYKKWNILELLKTENKVGRILLNQIPQKEG